MLIDSHCHLDYPDLYTQLDEVVNRAKLNDIKYLLTISTNLNSFEKIKTMPKYWLECNSQKKLDLIISNAQNSFYGRYHTCFELYGAIIRVCMNSYILYTMNSSIKLLFIYFLFYLAFYNYIILNSRTYVKNNNKTKSKYELLNKNLYLNYFNSCIGKYQSDYINILNNNNIKINKINLDNQVVDKIYLGSLQLFQKVLMCIYMYNYIRNNCENKCSLLLLPLYQTTITLVYQFEYIHPSKLKLLGQSHKFPQLSLNCFHF